MSATNQFPPPHRVEDNEHTTGENPSRVKVDTNDNSHAAGQPQHQLALPSTEADTTTSTTTKSTTQQLNVSDSSITNGKNVIHTITLDYLGPLVVNKDGTLSRIHNWAQMNDAERERVVRVLGKRNMLRTEAILKEEDDGK